MRKFVIHSIFLLFLVLTPELASSDTIEVAIKGVDDGIKSSKQQDYKEAVINAKLQAIERAGVEIKSITSVRNYLIHEDYIESKSEGILLPGYRIVDIGYTEDGTYQVVLVGELRVEDSLLKKPVIEDVLGWKKTKWGMRYEEICKLYNEKIPEKIPWLSHGISIIARKENDPQNPIDQNIHLFVDKKRGLIEVYKFFMISAPSIDNSYSQKYSNPDAMFALSCSRIKEAFERLEESLVVKHGKPILARIDKDRGNIYRMWSFPSTVIELNNDTNSVVCATGLTYRPNNQDQ